MAECTMPELKHKEFIPAGGEGFNVFYWATPSEGVCDAYAESTLSLEGPNDPNAVWEIVQPTFTTAPVEKIGDAYRIGPRTRSVMIPFSAPPQWVRLRKF